MHNIDNQSLSRFSFKIAIMSSQIKKTAMISSPHMVLALIKLCDITWAKQGNIFSWFWSILLSYF